MDRREIKMCRRWTWNFTIFPLWELKFQKLKSRQPKSNGRNGISLLSRQQSMCWSPPQLLKSQRYSLAKSDFSHTAHTQTFWGKSMSTLRRSFSATIWALVEHRIWILFNLARRFRFHNQFSAHGSFSAHLELTFQLTSTVKVPTFRRTGGAF